MRSTAKRLSIITNSQFPLALTRYPGFPAAQLSDEDPIDVEKIGSKKGGMFS